MNAAEVTAVEGGTIAEKAWDSQLFGFRVAEVVAPDASRSSLELLLERCRRDGARLVYWAAREGRVEEDGLLGGFEGRLVDRKTTFVRTTGPAPAAAGEAGAWTVEEEPPGPACEALQALAIAAGAFSRFRVDPRIPAGRFEQLYRTWIDRSTRREIADAVLVARDAEGILGMVTVAVRPPEARIGLIAVDGRARGRGLGRSLVGAAERRAASAGADRMIVVTQGANTAACRLYGHAGYEPVEVRNVHHFWLRGGRS